MEDNFIDDRGILIALTTFPLKEGINFYKSNIKEGFIYYKKELINHLLKSNEFSEEELNRIYENIYQPRAYRIFGKFDLAIISLIDDFELSCRSFHPYSYLSKDKVNQKFDYKIITGPKPFKNNGLLNACSNSFLRKEEKFPLVGITSLKINNFLLFEFGGNNLINHIVEFYVHLKEEFISNQKNPFESHLIESLGANELVLLTFSDSYKVITDFIYEIRESTLHTMQEKLKKFGLITDNERLKIDKDSFVKNFCFDESEISDLHVNLFEHSHTNLGYDLEIFQMNSNSEIDLSTLVNDTSLNNGNSTLEDFYYKIDPEDVIEFNTRWYLKSGRFNDFVRLINSIWKNDDSEDPKVFMGFGDGDSYLKNLLFRGNTKDLIEKIEKILFSDENGLFLIDESRTTLLFPPKDILDSNFQDLNDGKKLLIAEPDFDKFISTFQFDAESKDNIGLKLKEYGVSKVLQNRISKAIANYNGFLMSRSMFIYYLELYDFMIDTIRSTIDGLDASNRLSGEIDIPGYSKSLASYITYFEEAFNNRFFQTSITRDLTDFNTEYSGGAHRIISAYDILVKVYRNMYVSKDYVPDFILASSNSEISSGKFHLRVNYFHLFQPEIFISLCCFETSDRILEHLSDSENMDWVSGLDIDETIKNSINESNDSSLISSLRNYIIERHSSKSIEKLFNKRLISLLIQDTIALKLGYLDDWNLYSFWFWNNYVQLPNNFQSTGKINLNTFKEHLLRYLILDSFQKDRFKTNSELTDLLAPNPILQDVWLDNYPEIKKVKNLMAEKEDFIHWYTNIVKFSKYLASKNLDNKGLSDYDNVVKKYKKKAIGYIGSQNFIKSKNIHLNTYLDNLIKGNALSFEREGISSVSFVTTLSYAFLCMIKSDFFSGGRKYNSFLFRDPDKNNVDINQEFDSKILFDQLGGVYCYSPTLRKKYFRGRNTLIRSLWNLSVVEKSNRIKKHKEHISILK